MGRAETMICPRCGSAMNCHAEKPSDARNAEEAQAAEIMVETYCCPRCGAVASRRVSS